MNGALQSVSRDRCAVWLALMAVCVYLPGITWGLPHATNYERTHAWGNDDAAPLAALAEMHDTFVAPAANRNVAYPWGHYFLMACAMREGMPDSLSESFDMVLPSRNSSTMALCSGK